MGGDGRAGARRLVDRDAGAARRPAGVRYDRVRGLVGPDGVQPGAGGRDPARLAACAARGSTSGLAGLVVFASASFVCAVAPSIGVLIAARCVQALGGAAVVAAAIELLAGTRGSHRRAAPVWGTAGIVGLAVGPAAGGLLTELLSWEAIFLVQLPVILAVPAAIGRFSARRRAGPGGADRPGTGAGAGPALGRADRSALPARDHADRGMEELTARGGGDRLGRAGGDARRARPAAAASRTPRGRRRGDPGGGRPGGARPATRGRRRLDVRAPAPDRCRASRSRCRA